MDFSSALIMWYRAHKRDLPWRSTTDPYIIWVSEIVLQQTRVDQGLPYFYRFIERFPHIKSLAEAPADDVLKLWQGLGYYSRARNMHETAKLILNNYKGVFPEKYEDIRKLKGIGDYTAAAIASFAFGKPYPVVDGNVMRLLARYFGIREPINGMKGKKMLAEIAEQLVPRRNAAIYNQAIMEFGALQCKPLNPGCTHCPLQPGCFAFAKKLTGELPLKTRKNKVRKRFLNYLVIQHGNRIYLNRRDGNDIWKGLYDFPLIETCRATSTSSLVGTSGWKTIFGKTSASPAGRSPAVKHQLSHQQLIIQFCMLRVKGRVDPRSALSKRFLAVSAEKLQTYAVPRVIENFLKKLT